MRATALSLGEAALGFGNVSASDSESPSARKDGGQQKVSLVEIH